MDLTAKIKEIEKIEKFSDFVKAVEQDGDGEPIVIGEFETIPKGLKRGSGRIRNRRTNQDNPNYSITMIGQNTEKSPGDLRRLAVTQTPMKDHQQTLVWKTRKDHYYYYYYYYLLFASF